MNTKVALVVGGSGGIGRAVVTSLITDGAFVISASKSTTCLEANLSLKCDIRNELEVKNLISKIIREFNGIDYLINSAGVYRQSRLIDTTTDMWNEVISANATGMFFTMREVLGHMIHEGYGRIVNISSITGKAGAFGFSAYAASKHAILGLTRCIALEVADMDITVNAICPSYVDTSMLDNGLEQFSRITGKKKEVAERIIRSSGPQNRIYSPQEVAAIVQFLISDEAAGINGQAINLCGGSVFN